MQNATARLITGIWHCDRITPVLCELHWLPIWERVKFKVACLVRQSLSGHVPLYLADDCCLVSDSTRLSVSADVPTCMVCKHSAVTWQNLCSRWTSLVELSSSPAAQSRHHLCGPMDCSDNSWRETYFRKHESSALWLYFLTYIKTAIERAKPTEWLSKIDLYKNVISSCRMYDRQVDKGENKLPSWASAVHWCM